MKKQTNSLGVMMYGLSVLFIVAILAAVGLAQNIYAAPSENIDFCHLPQGNADNGQFFENRPESAYTGGHGDHVGDFIVTTEEEKVECLLLIGENTAPTITLTSGDLTINQGDPYEEPGYSADDAEDGDLTGDVEIDYGGLDVNEPGEYIITYTVTDKDGASAEETRTVTVLLVEEPTDLCPNVDGDQESVPEGYEIDESGDCVEIVVEEPTDLCPNIDGDQESVPEGYEIDESGDCVESDTGNGGGGDKNSAPTITLNGDETINLTEGDLFEDPEATATDEEDGDLTENIETDGSVDTGTPGTYSITYSVTDSKGATSEVTRTVIVSAAQSSGGSSGGGGGGGSSSGNVPDRSSNTTPQVLGASTVAGEETICPAFTQYLRRGDRDGVLGISQVATLQEFLNEHMGAGLLVDGIYGGATEGAVHAFQQLYYNDIIVPWLPAMAPATTGRFYKTSLYKAHEIIGCAQDPVFLEDTGTYYPEAPAAKEEDEA